MVMEMKGDVENFLDKLAVFESECVFNPWASNCEKEDCEESFFIRINNLRSVLNACIDEKDIDFWIGRDLGWRGGRRTGIALVDEASLADYAFSIDAKGLAKATISPLMKERTATEVHLARKRVSKKIFFWNVFPFHPHEKGNPQSNRMHTKKEHVLGLEFLQELIDLLPVGRVVTIGNDAAQAVQKISSNVRFLSVRHPSYGGQKKFHEQINAHYDIAAEQYKQKALF